MENHTILLVLDFIMMYLPTPRAGYKYIIVLKAVHAILLYYRE